MKTLLLLFFFVDIKAAIRNFIKQYLAFSSVSTDGDAFLALDLKTVVSE